MDDRQNASENPYVAPPIDADLALATSPFGLDLSQDEQIRREHLSHEASIRSVGLLYYLGAGLCVTGLLSAAAFTALPLLLLGMEQASSPNTVVVITGAFDVVVLLFLLGIYGLFAALFFFTGRGLRRLQPWSRIASGIISTLGLLAIPLGTLINAYILYLLLSRKATVIFSPEYSEIIARTPHIKYKTSLGCRWQFVGRAKLLLSRCFAVIRGSAGASPSLFRQSLVSHPPTPQQDAEE